MEKLHNVNHFDVKAVIFFPQCGGLIMSLHKPEAKGRTRPLSRGQWDSSFVAERALDELFSLSDNLVF